MYLPGCRVTVWALGRNEGPPPPLFWGRACGPILGLGNTKKHVLEVNWMVVSGYLPL